MDCPAFVRDEEVSVEDVDVSVCNFVYSFHVFQEIFVFYLLFKLLDRFNFLTFIQNDSNPFFEHVCTVLSQLDHVLVNVLAYPVPFFFGVLHLSLLHLLGTIQPLNVFVIDIVVFDDFESRNHGFFQPPRFLGQVLPVLLQPTLAMLETHFHCSFQLCFRINISSIDSIAFRVCDDLLSFDNLDPPPIFYYLSL